MIALLVLTAPVYSQEPQSKAAVAAIERYMAAKDKLDAEYQAKVENATLTLRQELASALDNAARAGRLEEANTIRSLIDRVVGATRAFKIEAAKDWQPTIEVQKGQRIEIEVEGQWLTDASRPTLSSDANGLNVGKYYVMYMEGRIGEGEAFRIGTSKTLDVPVSGMLQLRCYDPQRQDNAGSVKRLYFAGRRRVAMRETIQTYRPLLTKIVLGGVLSLASMGIADEPKSRAGLTALSRFNAAKSKIDADYRARLSRLNKVLEQELTGAMRAATRAGDLDEANAIKAKLEKVIGTTQSFQIDSREDWQATVVVTKGSRIVIEAEGAMERRHPAARVDV